MPLRGLWYISDKSQWKQEKKDKWRWTLMAMQPKQITKEMVDKAIESVAKKKNPPALPKV